jgi:hypothetical protein
VANLLVVIEFAGDRVHPASLEVLGQARRIGSALGATVFAIMPCAATPGYGEDDLIAVLSRGGADKVLLATSELFAGPARWGTHGPLVLSVCAQLPPTLLLFADTAAGRELGARAAAHLGAAFLTDAWLEIEGGELRLREGARSLEGELDFAVVAQVPSGRYLPATGDEEAEVAVVAPPSPAEGDFEELEIGPERPLAVVLGAGPAADVLAGALSAPRVGPPGREALAVALLPSVTPLAEGPAWRRAEIRVALGPGAGECAGATFGVEGDAAELATELARLVAQRAAGGGA